ncbi:MAG: Cro/Cl family transcriptional regulator [Comamonadaceae bacterium]|nr:MAG: Cro/Cl family transcriptional regulator [Comamonadaceae bacterium]
MNLFKYFKQQGRGAATRLAAEIGAFPSDVSDWGKGLRPVPVRFAVAIEAATNRVVSRKDLHPTDWQKIWPELIELAAAQDGKQP